MGDLELHEHLGLQADELVAGVQQRRLVVLLQPIGRGAHHIGGDGHLLERAVVHEPVIGAVVVEVLHLLGLKTHGIELRAGVEGVVDHAAGLDVLELSAYKRAALARLHMLELDDLHHVAVHFKGQAVFEIACGYHKNSSTISFSCVLRLILYQTERFVKAFLQLGNGLTAR